ncbi:CGNR zinc finger domain-containing protein [Ruania halotolerans]|uniref:CGNR zinc finger domain-containing protein n=1 Tax=Ruania halotolerans TaxID=2897773 RepID=UPI001E5F1E43|nr:CGNR zinc finger domain-containing protein [Ruania halotolerans]UFU07347.1 CGNR zinc finger domain-containing protein [Ruania halotolerans]
MNELLRDEALLLALLNTTPVDGGTQVDELGEEQAAIAWLRSHGGTGSPAELEHTRRARDALQHVVRDNHAPATLSQFLDGVSLAPSIRSGRLAWQFQAPVDMELAARAVITWYDIEESLPGRLRPCGNDECRRYLIDHSRGNRAQWCSMAVCGNRMKARRHYQRTREARSPEPARTPPA